MGTAIDMAFDGATLATCPLSALVLSFAFYGFYGWAWESTVCAMLNHGRIAALENTRDLLKEYSKDRVVFTLSAPLPSDFPIQVEKLQDGFYCLNYDTPEGLRILLDELHKRGLEPEGLELGKANLEEVFMRITSK